jgi:hypothetical protein
MGGSDESFGASSTMDLTINTIAVNTISDATSMIIHAKVFNLFFPAEQAPVLLVSMINNAVKGSILIRVIR